MLLIIVITTILIIILLFLLLWLIIKLTKNKQQIEESNKYNLLGGNNKEVEYIDGDINDYMSITINKPFPQVGVLTNNILRSNELKDFVYLDKTDGLHVNIALIYNMLCYIKRGKLEKVDIIKDFNTKLTILDGEYYEDKNYYIFDAVLIDGKDISDLLFIDRMKEAEKYINKNKKQLNNFIIKEYYKVDNLKDIITYVNTKETNKDNIKIDGVVFQLINTPYFNKNPSVYKLKRPVMNTIDFRLRYNEEKQYYKLYLSATNRDLFYNLKQLPYKEGLKELKERDNNKTFDLLFSSPFKEGCDIFKPSLNWNNKGYPISAIKEINILMSDIINDPIKYDNKIVELSLSLNGWVPMRIREDKQYPNSYKVGISNCSVIFSPITTDNHYFAKKTVMKEDITTPYHDINKIIRKFIIEHSINPLNKLLNVLDLAGGRGADELALYNSGVINIIAADNDREALVQYVNRTPLIPSIKYDFLLKESKQPDKLYKRINLNAVHATLSDNNDSIINDIKGRYEYPDNGFDIILMNYAIHYLCDSFDNMTALNKLITSLLNDDGLFIFSCFDGEKIYNDMTITKKGDKELKLKSFNIKIVEENDNYIIANMALPTIDESGYRNEPLVLDKYISKLLSNNLKIIETYNPTKEIINEITKINNYNNVIDYLNYIKVFVIKKNL